MRKRIITVYSVVLAIIGSFLLSAGSIGAEELNIPELRGGEDAVKNLIIKTDEQEYHISDFEEDFTALFFGKGDCFNTRSMVSTALSIAEKGVSLKVVMMDINDEDDMLHDFKETYPEVLTSMNPGYNADRMSEFLNATYQLQYSIPLPATFIIDRNGNIVFSSTGNVRNDLLKFFEDEEEKIIATGKCGQNASYTLKNTGTNVILTIRGEGSLFEGKDSEPDDIPWDDLGYDIDTLEIINGITEISTRAFAGLNKLTTVILPKNVSIGDYAFTNCTELKDVYFAGDREEWNSLDIGEGNDPLKDAALHEGKLTVSFETDGGSEVEAVEVFTGETVGMPDVPVKKGFFFDGWYKEESHENKWDFDKDTVLENVTIYARWTEAPATEEIRERVILTGSNIGRHNSRRNHVGDVGMPAYSYLVNEDGGYMRVQYQEDYGLFAEYYDSSFSFIKGIKIPMELPLFGGFYSDGTDYYIVTGCENPSEKEDIECYRITKYDKDWKKTAYTGLYDCNTYEPFAAGSCRMDSNDNTLFIHTCHTMYKAEDGNHHQANVIILVDTGKMTVRWSMVGKDNYEGYSSHSFNQFIRHEGNKAVIVNHGDAYPRTVRLTELVEDMEIDVDILDIPGEAGDNNTGVTVGGLEISDEYYLIACTHVNWDNGYDSSDLVKNVYLAKVDKEGHTVNTESVTSYPESEKGAGASNPYLIRLDDGRFMLLWSRFKSGVPAPQTDSRVYYKIVDPGKDKEEAIFDMEGYLSDAEPLFRDGKVSWYVYNEDVLTFYTIDTDTMKADSVSFSSEKDNTEEGGTEEGGTEKGGTEKGSTEEGNKEKGNPEEKKDSISDNNGSSGSGSGGSDGNGTLDGTRAETLQKTIVIPAFGSGQTVSMNISVNRSVSYNGKKHVSSTDNPGRSKTGDLDIKITSDLPNNMKITFKYKNNKSASGKTPYFYIKLKASGLEPEEKKRLKAINKYLKLPENRVEFTINPCDLSRCRLVTISYTKSDEGEIKIRKVSADTGGQVIKLSKKDYTMKRERGLLCITGRRNFTGRAYFDL